MSKHRFFPGQKYNMLTLVSLHEKKRGGHSWMCLCDCGKEKVISVRDVANGHTKSCGCMTLQWRSENRKDHGMSETKEFRVWCHMIGRCYCETDSKYSYYGGRGIKVSDRWHDFKNFYKDMGTCPFGMSIDRIDCNGDYETSNCRWADAKTQSQNRRFIKHVIVFGESMPAVEAERKLDLGYGSIRNKAYLKGITLQQSTDHFALQMMLGQQGAR